MNEIVTTLSNIPMNAYLMVVIGLQFWQSKNRDILTNKTITDMNEKNEHGMEKLAEALTKVGNALTEVSTLVKVKNK